MHHTATCSPVQAVPAALRANQRANQRPMSLCGQGLWSPAVHDAHHHLAPPAGWEGGKALWLRALIRAAVLGRWHGRSVSLCGNISWGASSGILLQWHGDATGRGPSAQRCRILWTLDSTQHQAECAPPSPDIFCNQKVVMPYQGRDSFVIMRFQTGTANCRLARSRTWGQKGGGLS